jgi:hypothetical protein
MPEEPLRPDRQSLVTETETLDQLEAAHIESQEEISEIMTELVELFQKDQLSEAAQARLRERYESVLAEADRTRGVLVAWYNQQAVDAGYRVC